MILDIVAWLKIALSTLTLSLDALLSRVEKNIKDLKHRRSAVLSLVRF